MNDSPHARRVLLCVTGGIAAYKAPELVRQLRRSGVDVQVVTTSAALSFVSELSLATVSGRPVRHALLDPGAEGQIGHIELADWAELVVVAPATAHTIAAAAHGLAGDLVTTCLLATRAPILFAPAMNTHMWWHPATQANLEILRQRGAAIVGPDAGDLACGWTGEGRMSDPTVVVEAVRASLERESEGISWRGRKVLVSAGPTRTYLDPVRFITNASSGAMGFAIADVAASLGAEVTLVSGPVDQPTPPRVRRIDVETAAQMLDAMDGVLAHGDTDLVAMVAAVSDFAASASTLKASKQDLLARLHEGMLSVGVDVLATLVERYGETTMFLGFGAQTIEDVDAADSGALERQGHEKLRQKRCHALFVNRVGVAGQGFGAENNTGSLLFPPRGGSAGDSFDAGVPRPKSALARWILDHLDDRLARSRP